MDSSDQPTNQPTNQCAVDLTVTNQTAGNILSSDVEKFISNEV